MFSFEFLVVYAIIITYYNKRKVLLPEVLFVAISSL